MEKILRIEEKTFNAGEDYYSDFDGFEIITTEQTIQIGISNGQSCCEDFGCIITNDETTDFIDAELKDISIVDTVLNNKKIDSLEYLNQGGVMFVNIETDKGLLQFAAYNAHNGYYGHTAVLISKQLNKSEGL